MHPIFVAALVTVFAHHIMNPSEDALTPVEMRTCLELITDLGIMIKARACDSDLTQYRDFCLDLFTKLETGSRTPGVCGDATLLGKG
jgi:hypothetical protein